MLTTVNGAPILTPEEIGELLVLPALSAAAAGRCSTTVDTVSAAFRIPLVSADPTAEWVAEGDEIDVTDATLDELTIVPTKLAGLSVITSELANDTSPQAAQVVGQGLARDIARKLDTAYFGALAPPAQSGLAGVSGIQTVINTNVFTNLDSFATAISLAQTVGAQVTHFAMGPGTALAMATVKVGTGFNSPLLGQDGSAPGSRTILGVPVIVSPACPADTAWAIDSSRSFVVVRSPAVLDTDASVYFTSDRIALRAILRVGLGFPHPASLVKISKT